MKMQTISNLLSSVEFGSVLLAVISFAAGTMFKSAIEHFFAQKQRTESRLHQEKEGTQKAVREQLLNMRLRKSAAIEERRIDALLSLWKYSVDASPLHLLARISETINYKNLIDIASKNDDEANRVKAFADGIWEMSGLKNYKGDASIGNARPLVPQIVWATFSAYTTALTHSAAQLAAARTGVGSKLLADPKPAIEMVRNVLPHFDKGLTEFGPSFLAYLANDLREKLFEEISKALDDPSNEEHETERATAILTAAAKVADLQQREQTSVSSLELR
jgi:hypothetical protein